MNAGGIIDCNIDSMSHRNIVCSTGRKNVYYTQNKNIQIRYSNKISNIVLDMSVMLEMLLNI